MTLAFLLSVSVPAYGQKISPGLARIMEKMSDDETHPVIVQMDPERYHPHGAPPGLLKAKGLDLVKGFAGEMDVKGIQGLVNSPWISYVTADAALKPNNDIFNQAIGIVLAVLLIIIA